ncbi:5-methyltetrahydropteroyltriglutamate--homocysteine S-methyltransferase [Aristophania vespae]|uniref:5-methyltetrahydropteroyltriglutamate-- homocysteine S-methyltransferase n=1 Tax=Aristophania vespae TaxID=2697033 RepID=UPI002351079D|nr:5-methyltetrahydropteroyltriglutamate--homocysteine S-methyltransferase [Aristophania vespae]UMM64267.1 5-methyltetrahydropteroyltriglutamate--homocysteine methyltransferase [Aristophania vespae]
MTVRVATLGFPRIGARRELKKALESFWAGTSAESELQHIAAHLRNEAWAKQKAEGADILPSNDFSFYDHVLDTSAMVGAIPKIYGPVADKIDLTTYFAIARGRQTNGASKSSEESCSCGHGDHGKGIDVPAAEMTKWFDTNYHFLVPEFTKDQTFKLTSTKVLDEYREARAKGFETRPVLLGPLSFLLLGKSHGETFDRLELLGKILPVYTQVLNDLHKEGAEWVQIDEPVLVLDLDESAKTAFRQAYQTLTSSVPSLKLMLTTYFGALGDNLETALSLPVHGLHVDLVRAPEQLDEILAKARPDLLLSLGIIDGRNIWKADLNTLLKKLEPVAAKRDLILAPSCSLLHTPIDLERETALDPDVKSWLAFAVQKIAELATLAKALNQGADSVRDKLAENESAIKSRKSSKKIHNPAVKERIAQKDPNLAKRKSPFPTRQKAQEETLHLPLFPTTTIGSFPQTADVRKARAQHAKGELSTADYNAFLEKQTSDAISWQEEVGLDVLVHGEFERNDMVQYFGEKLSGFVFTKHAWVQSYGSRYVRPPIIFGDVTRPSPMTLEWWRFAQSCTKKPVKGMLTGPVTILNWSFVRDDQPRSVTCRQIAFAIRDEVQDLEKAGCQVIQIDEAALREGLPLRRKDWEHYLNWAVESFRVTSSGVEDKTQIHTHMCYSEFNDIIDAISAMDTDVISIETARSKMELLGAFTHHHYPSEIGPGVYDIHSPRVPSIEEMVDLLKEAEKKVNRRQLWVNPDCGLKTRRWEEVKPAIVNMVEAAHRLRG